jgi:hypothetical protein
LAGKAEHRDRVARMTADLQAAAKRLGDPIA